MTDLSEPLFLLGPGFSAKALANLWHGPVFGSVRSETSLKALADTSIQPVQLADQSALKAAITGAHLLISAPPDDAGCPVLAALGDMPGLAASVTYLSTTGVYGDLRGGWAMEWSKPNPRSERAIRRVRAEDSWKLANANFRTVRLPGIYGPGRSALDRIRQGNARRIVKPGQVFSRVHVDDIATGLLALIQSEAIGVFHICDEEAAPPQDVIAFGAGLLGLEPPPEIDFEVAELSAMARSFYGECKRVSNARIKAATGWRPLFSTYRDGLQAVLGAEP